MNFLFVGNILGGSTPASCCTGINQKKQKSNACKCRVCCDVAALGMVKLHVSQIPNSPLVTLCLFVFVCLRVLQPKIWNLQPSTVYIFSWCSWTRCLVKQKTAQGKPMGGYVGEGHDSAGQWL